MSSEYVRCSHPEVIYGEKNLLQCQIGILEISKKLKGYESLRKEEFILKIALKNKIDELKNNMEALNKMLPRAKMPEKKKDNEDHLFRKEHLTLDEEIEQIRKKLDSLR